MKFFNLFLISTLVFLGCNNASTKTEPVIVHEQPERIAFFPVTDYIKGQLIDIREKGVNPKMFITQNNKQDSSWVKMEDMSLVVSDFLKPVIDSTNLSSFFTEKKFLDQSIDAFTLTYDPAKQLPDTFQLQHWDVYVDPETNKVKRIYLLKKMADHKTLQLTWQSDKWCKIVTIDDDSTGRSVVEKEVMIKWDF